MTLVPGSILPPKRPTLRSAVPLGLGVLLGGVPPGLVLRIGLHPSGTLPLPKPLPTLLGTLLEGFVAIGILKGMLTGVQVNFHFFEQGVAGGLSQT